MTNAGNLQTNHASMPDDPKNVRPMNFIIAPRTQPPTDSNNLNFKIGSFFVMSAPLHARMYSTCSLPSFPPPQKLFYLERD